MFSVGHPERGFGVDMVTTPGDNSVSFDFGVGVDFGVDFGVGFDADAAAGAHQPASQRRRPHLTASEVASSSSGCLLGALV